jgi:hypothetical protein
MTHDYNHSHHLHGPSATASVVLDIGGEIGALILHTGPENLGREIEISRIPRSGEPEPARTHSMVRERRTAPVTYDAVYPDLREGEYTVWRGPETSGRHRHHHRRADQRLRLRLRLRSAGNSADPPLRGP